MLTEALFIIRISPLEVILIISGRFFYYSERGAEG